MTWVIDQGQVRKPKKKPSKKSRGEFGHAPLSAEEEIPWTCRRLVIGTGTSVDLPALDDIRVEVERKDRPQSRLHPPRCQC